MNNKTPNILLFSTRSNYYFYDVNKNKILKVSKEIYELLNKMKKGETVKHPWITRSQQLGYLSSNRIEKIENPFNDVLEDYLSNKVKKITLQVTQRCNFRCQYCTYSEESFNRHHSPKEMTFETAKRCIDFLIDHSKDCQGVNVGFYGGEPLIKFELIKSCIEYIEKNYKEKQISFSITTNGSLINNEIIDYFSKHNVSLTISVDGPEHIHNKNRKFAFNNCGTFEKVMDNLKFVKEKYPEYEKEITISTVMDQEADFSCSNNFFSTDEILKDIFIMTTFVNDEYLQNKYKTNNNLDVVYEYEKFKLFLSMCNKIKKEYVSKLINRERHDIERFVSQTKEYVSGLLQKKGHHSGPCIPGQLRLFVDTDGKFYPCERVLESCDAFQIGDFENGYDILKVKRLLNIGELTQEECKNCFAIRECTICSAQIVEISEHSSELSRNKKLMKCHNVRRNTEEKFKDVCTLMEFGYDLEQEDKISDIVRGK